MKTSYWPLLASLPGFSFASPALAQEEKTDPQDPIVIEGEQDQIQARPSDGHVVAYYRMTRDQRLSTSGAKTGANIVQGNPQNFDPATQPKEFQREVRKASLFGRAKVNWETSKSTRELDTNSPLVRYNDAGRLAHCAILSVGEGVRDYIDVSAEPEYEALKKAYRYKHLQCADAAERSSPAEMTNAAMAEMMVLGYVEQPPLRVRTVDQAAAGKFLQDGKSKNGLDAIGRCLAVFSPGYAFDVLYTSPGSAEERRQLDMLYANTPECGLRERPKKVSEVYQRMAIAMGLYRWYGLSNESWREEG